MFTNYSVNYCGENFKNIFFNLKGYLHNTCGGPTVTESGNDEGNAYLNSFSITYKLILIIVGHADTV